MAIDLKLKSITIEVPSMEVTTASGTRRRGGIAIVELQLTLPDRVYGPVPIVLSIRKDYPTIGELAGIIREELVVLAADLAKSSEQLNL
jgi:hypothetical protein